VMYSEAMSRLIETVRVKVFIQSKRGQIRNKACEIACRGRESLWRLSECLQRP
jgi:hypothetical protein